MIPGYMGKILWIDLSRSKTLIDELKEDLVKKYVGGCGLATKILYDNTGVDTDPLGPENLLIFMTGPFTGTKIPLSGRHHVVARSPLTEVYGESDVGGSWGVELKKAGYDGIVVKGVAERPTYIWIHDGDVEFRDAGYLWGLDTYETDSAVKEETDPNAAVSCIGQAGERLTRISAIMSDGKHGRAAGRTGMGAVMGSKKLKAIYIFCRSRHPGVGSSKY